MATKTRVKFDSKGYKKEILNVLKKEQTTRLVDYAKTEILHIGDSFRPWDRTGNLLDSLCWAVYCYGELSSYGYYRATSATDDAYLHEYSKPPLKQKADGHVQAEKFIARYKPRIKEGWEIVFAVCAPYWGYWEEGHENPPHSGRRVQFAVMAERYDHVQRVLGSQRTTFSVYVPKY